MVIVAAILSQMLLALGQVLLKTLALNVRGVGWTALADWDAFLKVAIPGFSVAALYVLVTVLWLFVLQNLPLHRAFLFVALSFVFVPFGASLFLGESISIATIIGSSLIIFGIVVGVVF